jgi:hypothetical protein
MGRGFLSFVYGVGVRQFGFPMVSVANLNDWVVRA